MVKKKKKIAPTFRFPHSCVTVYVISIELHQVITSLLPRTAFSYLTSLPGDPGADSGGKGKPLRAKKKGRDEK